MKKIILLGSVQKTRKDGTVMFLCTGTNGEKVWSETALPGGTAVMITPRKKGDTYIFTKDDGTTEDRQYKKDSNSLDVVIGNVDAVKGIKLAKDALAEMD